MRFLLSLLLFVFIFGLALSVCVSQEAQAAEDDLIILDEDVQPQADTSPILDFFQRHFGIAGGGFYAGGGGAFEQGFGFGSASFDYPFTLLSRKGRLFVAGGYSYRQVELTLEFEEDFPNIGSTMTPHLQIDASSLKSLNLQIAVSPPSPICPMMII